MSAEATPRPLSPLLVEFGDARLPERIWRKVVVSGDCWLWPGSLSDGYAYVRLNGKTSRAHRMSWCVFVGPIPDGLCVCHHCDVRNCFRPSHLFVGTRTDNMQDMLAKGRKVQPSGTSHGRHKITPDTVRVIRRLASEGGTNCGIGSAVGLSKSQVQRILCGDNWSHVE